MPNTSNDALCAEAERLIELAHESADPSRHDELLQEAYGLLAPLVAGGVARAQYLHACFTLSLECGDEHVNQRRHIELVQRSAEAGCAEAQFALGQFYDKGGELGFDAEKSAHWFQLSAEQGYVYAQWVHGLNLLFGEGVTRDETAGLGLIRQLAERKFEGALQFMAEAYSQGAHGFPKDEKLAEEWRRKLSDPDVIGY